MADFHIRHWANENEVEEKRLVRGPLASKQHKNDTFGSSSDAQKSPTYVSNVRIALREDDLK
jgi:hypothetical protein